MTFTAQERQRCVEIIYDEWEKGSGIVKTKDVYQRLNAEGIYPPDWAMESLLKSLEGEGVIRAAKMLGRDAIAQHGNMWITRVANHTPDELRRFASILQDVVRGETNIEDAQAAVQIDLPDLAPLTRELARTRNVNLRIAFIQMLLTLIGWLIATQTVAIDEVDVEFAPDINITYEQDQN
jgi:hypothetical protein